MLHFPASRAYYQVFCLAFFSGPTMRSFFIFFFSEKRSICRRGYIDICVVLRKRKKHEKCHEPHRSTY
ncbi:uncharacterized protein BO72DRAFT_295345 [Aspergillus fijiensis CBS 313.89]|uniref:Uncharacterized protein n=1 Tax=Aspergillus fijiensis CBS 313.89 TaxID=1448319 RepID=A0A8G1RI55_9EURO|nr:uncharacterized protein BO72DRAFT_295345 [Aspergillus fijiensis CBS 313.89]RAK71906.1 hypothetical protein BO72DRAFT_295345 [Aspergillus fijiensis CBS 313.89]